MSNQNRFLLPHQPSASSVVTASSSQKTSESSSTTALGQENEYEVDTDFDSYWEEEARNPNRNRIRIGRQYQATVPPLLKQGEKDQRKLEDLETLSFCPKRSAKVTNSEIDHYFKVAKSLNLFASLVETRSLLGRDVTIADLNRIRQKEGLSLASVIQPPSRQAASSSSSNLSQQPQQTTQTASLSSSGQQQSSPSNSAQQQQPPLQDTSSNKPACSSSSTTESQDITQDNVALNQPLMKALSHFISLHHPCYHDGHCKKLIKDIPLEDEDAPTVSITAGNLRGSPSKEIKSRSRSKSVASKIEEAADNASSEQQAKDQVGGDINNVEQQQQQNRSAYEDWTREEVELFSKAIEVCGKNFGSIKKEFLPSKSVRSIVEYYYIGSRDAPDNKSKKSNQSVEAGDSCSSPEKIQANNNGQGGGGGSGSAGGDSLHLSGRSAPATNIANFNNQTATSTGRSSASNNNNNNNNSHNNGKNISDAINSEKLVTAPIYNNNMNQSSAKTHSNLRQPNIKIETSNTTTSSSGSKNNKSKNIDARLSVYNFDDEIKEEASPVRFECPRPGAEVRPLKAKPIMPSNPGESEAGNSNVGSLKFFMDGQLVLKLNACQEQQEGSDKCHWVQSGDKLPAPSNKQKRYSKRAANDRTMSDLSQNGSQSNSVVSSNHDDDSKNEDLMSADEDSKESANSFSHNNHNIVNPRPKSFSASPTPKRARSKTEASISPNQGLQQHQQLPFPYLQQQQQQQQPSPLPPQPQLSSPIDYNRLAVSNRMKERCDNNSIQHNNNNSLNHPGSPLANQAAAAAAAMPWLQANSLAMAAALLGGLPFPSAASGLVNNNNSNPMQQGTNMTASRPNLVNMATKPMDLSVEHGPPKPIPAPKPSRSRSKQKN